MTLRVPRSPFYSSVLPRFIEPILTKYPSNVGYHNDIRNSEYRLFEQLKNLDIEYFYIFLN